MGYIKHCDGEAFSKENKIVASNLYGFMGMLDGMKWATDWSAVELRP
jgi:hypothetical protein